MSYPIDRFAAFLAHAMNQAGPSGLVALDAGQIYVQALEVLATRHADILLQHPRYAGRMDVEEAAARYFELTLERPLFQAAQAECTSAHRLFLALCQRAGGAWCEAGLERRAESASATALRPPEDWKGVVSRLSRCDPTVSQSNAATSHRQRKGPMVLVCGPAQVAVPEQMSLWEAICCAPRALAPMAPGDEFNTFCRLLINALRTANRPFQELLSLGRGLCPFDWLDLSVNQVRSVGRFLKSLEQAGGNDGEAAWRAAWQQAPVAGHRSVEAFRESELGVALRQGGHAAAIRSAEPLDAHGEEDAALAALLQADAFAAELRALAATAVITAIEAELLVALYGGSRLDELEAEPRFATLLSGAAGRQRLALLLSRIESAQGLADDKASRC